MHFRVHHVAISVADIADSLDFYLKLGFQEVMEWADPTGSPRICHLKLGDTMLELFWFADHRPAPESADRLETDLSRIGCKHFALEVGSLEQARDFVLEKGLATEAQIIEGRTGVRYFFISDPSGILLEFVEDRRGI